MRESEQRLGLALESSGLSLWDCDVASGAVYLDENWSAMLGGPRKPTRTTVPELLAITHPEDRERIFQDALRVLKGNAESYAEDHRVRDAGGNWAWIHSTGRVVERNAEGRAVRAIGTNANITERRRAEQALRESEARYRALYEDNVAGLMVATQEGRLLDCNAAMVRIHGFASKAELQAVNLEQLYADPRDRRKLMETLRTSGQVSNYEARQLRKDGSTIWVMRSLRLVENPAGGPPLIFGTAVDVTKRKEAEAALTESEKQLHESQDLLRHTVNNAPVIAFSIDAQGRFVLSEGRGLAALGLKPGEVVGQTIFDLYSDNPGIIENFRRAMAGEEFTAANTIPALRLTHETAMRPLRNARGEIVGVTGVATDITERERAEAALRESEERLRLAMHAADMGVWEWDAATDRSTWDTSLHRIMGVAPGEFDGRTETLANLIHPEDRQKFLISVEQAARLGEVYQLDFRLIRPDGRTVWIADRGRPEFDASGKLLRFRGVARDVTQQRELREQLNRAQKMEAVGQLAGGVAHDFNNLLMVIRGNAEVLWDHLATEGAGTRSLEALLQAADRAAGITRQLLAFSRRQVLQPKVVELGRLVSETAGLLRRVIGPATQLELQMPPEALYVRVDAGQIDQVVLNLVINARDAMPEGGKVTLRVDRAAAGSEGVRRLRFPQMPDADYVRLTVQDTGTGMDAATQARIFEPFFTTKELGKGTGLGLATVYGIVKQSEGWIWVDSEPGAGTKFEVFLPEVPAPEEVAPAKPQRFAEARGTETLLVVDDEPDILELATGYLSGLGYQVIGAGSGEQALAKIGALSGPLDLLITDAQMPGTPGLRLAQTVRELRPEARVLYISGYAEDSGIPGRLPQAGEDFLQKPFALTELAAKIRELLRK